MAVEKGSGRTKNVRRSREGMQEEGYNKIAILGHSAGVVVGGATLLKHPKAEK